MRCETAAGSFEAPAEWTSLGGVGAVEAGEPSTDRRSIVASRDALAEGQTPAAYLAVQRHLLAELLPGFQLLAAAGPDEATGGVGLLRFRFDLDEAVVEQRQGYRFADGRVAVLTVTSPATDPPDPLGESCLLRAVETFVFASDDPA